MKMIKMFVMVLTILAMCTGISFGAVSGPCANCHTMHGSQDGEVTPSDELHSQLLINDCIGCHSSSTSHTTYEINGSTVPVVNYTGGSAPTEHLAGGNFWWVADEGGNDDAKGHNVFGLSGQDEQITETEGAPRAGGISCANSCHSTLAVEQTSVNNLGSGCQGCHMINPDISYHHAGGDDVLVNSSDQGWYRFLAGHIASPRGVVGLEDDDWEDTSSATDHNEYYGAAGSRGTTGALTMTGFCTGCHGNFHTQQTNSDWVRHPSDAVIPNSGEYSSYITYDPNVPVARPNLTGWTEASSTVTPGTDLVQCLSCHRPHGSPYDDILRFEYSEMVAGSEGTTGCFVCHTTK